MFQHVQAAWARPDLTSSIQQVVLLFLADKANDDGMMRWSVPNIAKACRASEKTVRVVLKELYDNGVIGSESEPHAGAVTHWIVSDDPTFLFKTPVAITKVRKRGRKAKGSETPVIVEANPGNCAETPVIVTSTPVAITDKADRSRQKQPVKQQTATADAAPVVAKKTKLTKPDKTDTQKAANLAAFQTHKLFHELFAPMQEGDAKWMSITLQKQLRAYSFDEIAGTLRAVAAQKPNAKADGLTVSFISLGLWVEEWLANDRPAVFPSPVKFRRSGENHDRPVSRFAASSQRIADADRVRAAREQYQAGGVAAGAG